MRYTQFVTRLHVLSFHGFFFLSSLVLNTHPCSTGTCPFQYLSCTHLSSDFTGLISLTHLFCWTLIYALPITQPHFWGPVFCIGAASSHNPVLSFLHAVLFFPVRLIHLLKSHIYISNCLTSYSICTQFQKRDITWAEVHPNQYRKNMRTVRLKKKNAYGGKSYVLDIQAGIYKFIIMRNFIRVI